MSRLSRRPSSIKIAAGAAGLTALAGTAAAPAYAELAVTQASDPGTVAVVQPETQSSVSVQAAPPPPAVEVQPAPSPSVSPPAETSPPPAPAPEAAPSPQTTAPSPQATVSPQPAPESAPPATPPTSETPAAPNIQPTGDPQSAGSGSEVQNAAPTATVQPAANPQGEASGASAQPATGAPPSVGEPGAEGTTPPAPPVSPGASVSPATPQPESSGGTQSGSSSSSAGLTVQTSSASTSKLSVQPSPAQQPIHVSTHPTGGQAVSGADLQGGAPQVPPAPGDHGGSDGAANGSSVGPSHSLQGSDVQPQGNSQALQGQAASSEAVQPASEGSVTTQPVSHIAQPSVTPAPAPKRDEKSHSSTSGDTPCSSGTLYDGIGGGLLYCPQARSHKLTVILGVGDGGSVSIEPESVEELGHVRIHSEISAGAGPVQGGVNGDIPFGHGGDGPSVGLSGGTTPFGPSVDLSATQKGLALSGSIGQDLSGKDSSEKTAKSGSGSTRSSGKGGSRDGVQASASIEIPIPEIPHPQTWSYVVAHPFGSRGPALPLFTGF
ncbi:MAG: hypothetical protein WBV85_07420 [Solirubrobacteraceae bacterium]